MCRSSLEAIRNTIEIEDFYEYQAEFIPDNPDVDDVLAQNNRATAFTHVLGAANVLLIEDWENSGNFDTLVERLRDQEINITVQTSDQLFTSRVDLLYVVTGQHVDQVRG